MNAPGTSSAHITIRSYYYDDMVNGIRVIECTDTEVPFVKDMFNELKEVCNRETRTDKPDLV